MAIKRPSSPPPTSSSKPPSDEGFRSPVVDLFPELHAYRRRLAARFNYDDARLLAYIDSIPIPPEIRVIDIPAQKKRAPRNPK